MPISAITSDKITVTLNLLIMQAIDNEAYVRPFETLPSMETPVSHKCCSCKEALLN